MALAVAVTKARKMMRMIFMMNRSSLIHITILRNTKTMPMNMSINMK